MEQRHGDLFLTDGNVFRDVRVIIYDSGYLEHNGTLYPPHRVDEFRETV